MIDAYVYGFCPKNPGPASIGVHISTSIDRKFQLLYKVSQSIGLATINIAEWAALIVALEYLASQDRFINEEIEIISGSRIVVNQVNNEWKTKDPKLKLLKTKADTLLQNFSNIKIKYTHKDIVYFAGDLAKEAIESIYTE